MRESERSEGLKRMFCILLAGLKRLTKSGQQQQQLDANVAISLSLSLSNAPRGVLSLVTIARRALTKYFHWTHNFHTWRHCKSVCRVCMCVERVYCVPVCVCFPVVLSAWHVPYLCLPFASLSDKIVLNIYAFLLWLLCLAGAFKKCQNYEWESGKYWIIESMKET